jgi:hypothetical protein
MIGSENPQIQAPIVVSAILGIVIYTLYRIATDPLRKVSMDVAANLLISSSIRVSDSSILLIRSSSTGPVLVFGAAIWSPSRRRLRGNGRTVR